MLQIVHALGRRRRRQLGGIANSNQPLSLGAEQRLEYQFPTLMERLPQQRRWGLPRVEHPGRRCRHTRSAEQKTGHALVDAAFNGAAVIVDTDTEVAERMQYVEVVHHLFQAAARHTAYENPGWKSIESGHDHLWTNAVELEPALPQ